MLRFRFDIDICRQAFDYYDTVAETQSLVTHSEGLQTCLCPLYFCAGFRVDADTFVHQDAQTMTGMPCVTYSTLVAEQIGDIGFQRADSARRSFVGHLVRSARSH
jgi:hypothetical protein